MVPSIPMAPSDNATPVFSRERPEMKPYEYANVTMASGQTSAIVCCQGSVTTADECKVWLYCAANRQSTNPNGTDDKMGVPGHVDEKIHNLGMIPENTHSHRL